MISKKAFLKNNCLYLLIVATVLCASCKKSGSDKEDKGNEENTFTINGTKFKADDVFYNEDLNTITAQKITSGTGLNDVQTLSIKFNEYFPLPTTDGSFTVVDNPNKETNSNEVLLRATIFPYDNGTIVDDEVFQPVLSPVQKVTVTVSESKINVKFSDLAFTSQKGNATISGNISLDLP